MWKPNLEALDDRILLSSFQTIVPLGSSGSWSGSGATAVSADGRVVVGESSSSHGPDGEGFARLANGKLVGLGSLNDDPFYSSAHGISADGKVVVGYASSRSWDDEEAFRWIAGRGMRGLGDLPGGESRSSASAASADGKVIVGGSSSALGPEAFRWTPGSGMVGLGYLPGGNEWSGATGVSADGKVVVGGGSTALGSEAFRWTSSTGMVGLGFLPGRSRSGAAGVSADGSTVVGSSWSPESGFEAFRWTATEGMVGLGDLPGGPSFSTAESVSADGSVIVGWSDSWDGREAFVWDKANGMRSLQTVLASQYGLGSAIEGWTLEIAEGMSADGTTIVGYGQNPAGKGRAWVAHLSDLRIKKVDLHDIDGSPLKYLSISEENIYFEGNTLINGLITVQGGVQDGLYSLALEIVQNGEVRATASLAPSATDLLRTFGPTGVIKVTSSELLFMLSNEEAAGVDASQDGTVTLRVKATSANGDVATRVFGEVQILTRYAAANRYGPRDESVGGDDWLLPSLIPLLEHYSDIQWGEHE